MGYLAFAPGSGKDESYKRMKMPERSHTSRVSQIVQTFCPKVPFLSWIERRTHTDTHTDTHIDTHTADAGGNNPE